MGKGRGGYTEKQTFYRDSGGHKVTDKGAMFVAEQYMKQGYEVVFRRIHAPDKTHDLTIKTADDKKTITHIEVKRINSTNPSQAAKNIKKAFEQGPNVALDGSRHDKDVARRLAMEAFAEAKRKGNIKKGGIVEVWYKDGTKEVLS